MIYWNGVEASWGDAFAPDNNEEYVSLERSNESQEHFYQKVIILEKSQFLKKKQQ